MRAVFKDLDLNVLKTLMDVNFWGTVYCTRYALPYILQSRGSIVGISSIAGFKGLPARSGYSASKFAMNGFLETLRIEHLKSGLHVLIIAPGFTTSEIRKRALGPDGVQQGESPRDESKMMSSQEVAHQVITGIAKRKRNMILTWQGKLLVMLQRILPKIIDRLEYAAMKKEPDSPLE
jgi:short-subunit dehydrogenase